MKTYKITYYQKYMGQTLKDSYIKTVKDFSEIKRSIKALYEDPHVFHVNYEALEDNNE